MSQRTIYRDRYGKVFADHSGLPSSVADVIAVAADEEAARDIVRAFEALRREEGQ